MVRHNWKKKYKKNQDLYHGTSVGTESLVHPRRPIGHAHVSYKQSKDVTQTLGQVECQNPSSLPKCIGSSSFLIWAGWGGWGGGGEKAKKKEKPKKKRGEKEKEGNFSCTYKGTVTIVHVSRAQVVKLHARLMMAFACAPGLPCLPGSCGPLFMAL